MQVQSRRRLSCSLISWAVCRFFSWSIRCSARILLGILLIGWVAGVASAVGTWNVQSGLAHSQIDRGDQAVEAAQSLEHWIDEQREERQLAAVAMVVVAHGQIAYQQAWGYAHVEQKRAFDPTQHLTPIGSVSKAFLWIALLREIAAGRLNLSQDLSFLLQDLEVRGRYAAEPLTLEQLMTHRSGLVDRVMGLTGAPQDALNWRDQLRASAFVREFEPGVVPAYSNEGAALAAFVLERAVGQAYAQYLESEILLPAGLQSTWMPEGSRAFPSPMQVAQLYGQSLNDPQAPDWPIAWPAGGIWATPQDMGRLMLATLTPGLVLPEAAWELMLKEEVLHPHLPPMGLGWYRVEHGGRLLLAQGGDTRQTHTDMILDPASGVGLYVMVSGAGKKGEGADLRDAILAKWLAFQEQVQPPTPLLSASAANRVDARELGGSYLSSRSPWGQPLAFVLPMQDLRLRVYADGTLETRGGPDWVRQATPTRKDSTLWWPHGPDTWQTADGSARLAVKRSVQGDVIWLALSRGDTPLSVWLRAPAVAALLPWVYVAVLLSVVVPFVRAAGPLRIAAAVQWAGWIALIFALGQISALRSANVIFILAQGLLLGSGLLTLCGVWMGWRRKLHVVPLGLTAGLLGVPILYLCLWAFWL